MKKPLIHAIRGFSFWLMLAATSSAERVEIHVKTPQQKFGDPSGPERRLLTRNGKPAAQNQQFDLRTRQFKLAVDDIFWGDVQVQAVAATGERGIVKSTHDLMGVKSFSYRPEHYGPEALIEPGGSAGPQDDNAINNYGDTYARPSETLRLILPVAVHDLAVIVVMLGTGESLVWRTLDKEGREIGSGIRTAADGQMIDHIDQQNEFGKGKTCRIRLPTKLPCHALELEAGPQSGYSLAGIVYRGD